VLKWSDQRVELDLALENALMKRKEAKREPPSKRRK
jgi:hypothetical protein